MRLVSVTRILNEDDIVEAFVRHHATMLDHMVFLDNGSSDTTIEILRALQAEGLPVSVFQTMAASFDEVSVNTWLYRLADQMHRADWVVFLDADEFVTVADGTLGGRLARWPPHDQAMTMALVQFHDTEEDPAGELIVPVRMRWRRHDATGVFKLSVRGGLATRVTIDAGNHGGMLDGRPLSAPADPHVTLAHYARRSGWHDMQKFTIGWLKVLAAGGAATEAGRSSHYRSPFETLRDKPHELIPNGGYIRPAVDRAGAIEAPIDYRGGALRHTVRSDPAMKAFTLAMRYAEQLARQHGALLDRSVEARHLVATWNAERRFLF